MITVSSHKNHRQLQPSISVSVSAAAAAETRLVSNQEDDIKMGKIVVAMGEGNLLEKRKHALIANKGYQDHKDDPVVNYEVTPHRGATRQFPTKLYEMLSQASKEGFDDIVSWQPHGRAFLVRKPSSFVSDIMHR